MRTFQFDKGLPSAISNVTGKMDSLFDVVFEKMVYFRQELDRHSGKAARKLRRNMDDNIDFFSRASFSLMTFLDTMEQFTKAIDAVDEGDGGSPGSVGTRAGRQYEYSREKAEEEIRLDPLPLEEATGSFEENLQDFEEMLSAFHRVLDDMKDNTDFPWAQ